MAAKSTCTYHTVSHGNVYSNKKFKKKHKLFDQRPNFNKEQMVKKLYINNQIKGIWYSELFFCENSISCNYKAAYDVVSPKLHQMLILLNIARINQLVYSIFFSTLPKIQQ